MNFINKFLFVIASISIGIILVELTQAGSFGQRYGANSYITTQPLYFHPIDEHGRLLRENGRLVTAPEGEEDSCVANVNTDARAERMPQEERQANYYDYYKANQSARRHQAVYRGFAR